MLSESLGQAILATKITGPQLDAYLNTSQGLKAWRVLLNSRSLSLIFNKPSALALVFGSGVAIGDLLSVNGAALAASDGATEAICQSGSALLTIVSDESLLNLWNNVPANKTRLKNQVNAPGSKIKSYNYTTVGSHTLTLPSGYLAVQPVLVGAGGKGSYGDQYYSGGSSFSVYSGPGGGGGEVKTRPFSGGDRPPAGNITITIAIGSNTTFGAFLTAIKGGNATGGSGSQSTSQYPQPGQGGGTNSNQSNIYVDLPNEVWQPATASRKGASGGSPSGSSWSSGKPSGNGNAGGSGLNGSGGGTAGVTTGSGGPGTSIGAGGGSAGYNGLDSGTASSSASVAGAGSGGVAGGSGSTGNGGPGAAYVRIILGD